MDPRTLVAALCLFVASANAGIFTFDPSWNTLRVTWGLNLFNSYNFAKMPLNTKKATDKGFLKMNAESACMGQFLGQRYMKPHDHSVIMMYDNNGYFAGIQTAFSKKEAHPEALAWLQKNPMFVEEKLTDDVLYVLSAYLVEPEIICTTGRTKEQYEAAKSGQNLYIQNGPNPLKNYFKIPLYENETKATLWKEGKCFPTMGEHYWYNVSKEMSCDDFVPIFALYNHDKLTGFGFAVPGHFSSSRYEHPSKDQLKKFLDPVPKCLYDLHDKVGDFSALHIYMNAKPWNLVC